MYRYEGIFDLKEREIIYNTFSLAQFNYYPMVWHFCGKASTKKIELIQERALRFLLNDQKSTYHELLEKCNYTTMLIRRIKEFFKSLHDLNPNFMKEMFNIKELKYAPRHSNIIYQSKFEKVTHGKSTFNSMVHIYRICYQIKLRRQQIFYLLKV